MSHCLKPLRAQVGFVPDSSVLLGQDVERRSGARGLTVLNPLVSILQLADGLIGLLDFLLHLSARSLERPDLVLVVLNLLALLLLGSSCSCLGSLFDVDSIFNRGVGAQTIGNGS
jgi:hypothetical protein